MGRSRVIVVVSVWPWKESTEPENIGSNIVTGGIFVVASVCVVHILLSVIFAGSVRIMLPLV